MLLRLGLIQLEWFFFLVKSLKLTFQFLRRLMTLRWGIDQSRLLHKLMLSFLINCSELLSVHWLLWTILRCHIERSLTTWLLWTSWGKILGFFSCFYLKILRLLFANFLQIKSTYGNILIKISLLFWQLYFLGNFHIILILFLQCNLLFSLSILILILTLTESLNLTLIVHSLKLLSHKKLLLSTWATWVWVSLLRLWVQVLSFVQESGDRFLHFEVKSLEVVWSRIAVVVDVEVLLDDLDILAREINQ